jgi:hypothetical protein
MFLYKYAKRESSEIRLIRMQHSIHTKLGLDEQVATEAGPISHHAWGVNPNFRKWKDREQKVELHGTRSESIVEQLPTFSRYLYAGGY